MHEAAVEHVALSFPHFICKVDGSSFVETLWDCRSWPRSNSHEKEEIQIWLEKILEKFKLQLSLFPGIRTGTPWGPGHCSSRRQLNSTFRGVWGVEQQERTWRQSCKEYRPSKRVEDQEAGGAGTWPVQPAAPGMANRIRYWQKPSISKRNFNITIYRHCTYIMYDIKGFAFDILISQYFSTISHPKSKKLRYRMAKEGLFFSVLNIVPDIEYNIDAYIWFLFPKQDQVFLVRSRLTAIKNAKWILTIYCDYLDQDISAGLGKFPTAESGPIARFAAKRHFSIFPTFPTFRVQGLGFRV